MAKPKVIRLPVLMVRGPLAEVFRETFAEMRKKKEPKANG